MAKKILGLTLVAACFIIIAACGQGKKASAPVAASANPGEVVASVDGTSITAAELDEAAKSRLQRVAQEIFEAKKDVLDDLVENKMIEAAAKKQGKSVEAYLKENIDDKITAPSDDEIKSFYESRKDQLGGKSLKDTEGQIKTFLSNSKKQGLRQQLISGLKTASNVKINLVQPRVEIDVGDAPTIGPKSAPVTIIEFTDYQCPFCSRVRPTVNQIIDEYKDKVRYALRDFPLSFHQFSKKAHEAAHCAGDQGKYWEYSKELWANQQALQVEKLKEYAKTLKLSQKKFDECLDSGKYTKAVEANVAAGAAAGAQGTPSFFINGIFLSGARPIGDFKNIIDNELKK